MFPEPGSGTAIVCMGLCPPRTRHLKNSEKRRFRALEGLIVGISAGSSTFRVLSSAYGDFSGGGVNARAAAPQSVSADWTRATMSVPPPVKAAASEASSYCVGFMALNFDGCTGGTFGFLLF